MTNATETSDSARRTAILKDANDLLGGAAKWLIGALGAIGAVLVAGSQISTIGSLPLGTRFFIAVGGLCVGLASVLWSIWQVVELLTPDRYTITNLSKEWDKSHALKGSGVRGRRKRRKYAVVDWFARNPEYLANHDSPTQLLAHWNDKAAPDRDKVLAAINDMVQLANYRGARSQFMKAKPKLGVSMLIAALGICLFAWAANPGKTPAPSMRNVDLSNADLRGAFLANVDFTGANLTNANLRGANLKGSTFNGVIWKNTICPDGTNSSDTAGKSGKPSCVGHLEG